MITKILKSGKIQFKKISHRIIVFVNSKIILYKIKKIKKEKSTIARIQHMGDIIAAEPISRTIKTKNNYVIWLVRKEYVDLVKENRHIDKVIIINSLCELKRLSYSKSIDHFYDLHFHGETCHICNAVYQRSRCLVSTMNYYSYCNLLHAFQIASNIDYEDIRPNITYQFSPIFGLPSKFVVIHREVQHIERRWRADKWNHFIEEFLTVFPEFFLFEIGKGKEGNRDIQNNRYRNFSGKLSISESSFLIHHCKVFIGIDSGPAHIAHSLGTPSIILLGKFVNFINYMPYSGEKKQGETTTIIDYSPSLCSEIPVSQVIGKVKEILA